MNEDEQALFDRISRCAFDQGDEQLTFARRLARENDWTKAYTARVIYEYKRFIFLAVVAGHPVTPSDQVDQVWHLHLTYTNAYWDQFCGQVLGRPLHHHPTRGGPEEARKFKRCYQKTRESYLRFFGHEPPADVWPDGPIRFGEAGHFQRINTKRHWVIRKPRLSRATGPIVVLLVTLVSCTAAIVGNDLLGAGGHSRTVNVPNSVASLATSNWGAAGLVLFLLVVALSIYYGNPCPECKRKRALEKTGAKADGGWFKAGQEEWICKYCGHVEWKADDTGSGCG